MHSSTSPSTGGVGRVWSDGPCVAEIAISGRLARVIDKRQSPASVTPGPSFQGGDPLGSNILIEPFASRHKTPVSLKSGDMAKRTGRGSIPQAIGLAVGGIVLDCISSAQGKAVHHNTDLQAA
jgi:hypothetical protein